MKSLQGAFTLIEILVVVTIISLLAAAGAVSYTAFAKNSRDARRKADIEQIRGAAELFKSNSDTNAYPDQDEVPLNCPGSGSIQDDAGNTYMSKVPNDPRCDSGATYYYDVDATTGDYTLGAYLESGGTACSPTVSCGTNNCNYCTGPYGER